MYPLQVSERKESSWDFRGINEILWQKITVEFFLQSGVSCLISYFWSMSFFSNKKIDHLFQILWFASIDCNNRGYLKNSRFIFYFQFCSLHPEQSMKRMLKSYKFIFCFKCC